MVVIALDHSLLVFVNGLNQTLFAWKQFQQCVQCPLLFWSALPAFTTTALSVSTDYDLEYALTTRNESSDVTTTLCRNTRSLRDQSVHNINVTDDGAGELVCDWATENEGRTNSWPLIVAAIVYVAIAVLFYGGRRLFRRWRDTRAMSVSLPTAPTSDPTTDDRKRKRLKSLDCFRGITILMMIFVNLGCGDYSSLDHTPWDGLHFADIIFPFFVFIMGTTLAISFKSLVVRKNTPLLQVYFKIAKRSLNLFLIGLILNSRANPDFHILRIPGVLQRFAISYLVVASAHVLSLRLHRGELFGSFRIPQLIDVIPFWPEWILVATMTGLYFALTFGWRFDPRCPRGYVGPGGLHMNASYVHCQGGAAHVIDRWLFSDQHIYRQFTANTLYDPNGQFGLIHDPEGLLGTTTSIVLTFFGLQIGKILNSFQNPRQRITRWLIWGSVLAGLCAALAAPGWVPINKNLWSFSYICLMGAAACFALSVLYYLIDVVRVWPDGQPFHYPGMNPILLYIGHEITGNMIPWNFKVDQSSHIGPLAKNLLAVSIWFIVSVVLARKGFFLSL